MQGIIALPSKNQRKKYTHENHLDSSDQLYMQRTNKHQRAGGKVGAWVQKVLEGAGELGGGRRHRNILLTCRWRGSRTWGSICMFRYRRPT